MNFYQFISTSVLIILYFVFLLSAFSLFNFIIEHIAIWVSVCFRVLKGINFQFQRSLQK